MRLFLDSVDVDLVMAYRHVVSGVTTNPSLIASYSGRDSVSHVIKEICDLVGHVSVEVLSESSEDMIAEARKLVELSRDSIVIKLPMTEQGIRSCRIFADLGIKTNVTLCFSLAQVMLAINAGATFVSTFVGRLDDVACDGNNLVKQASLLVRSFGYSTHIIAASIRSVQDVVRAAAANAHIATVPQKVLQSMFKHPLTDAGLQKFLSDSKNSDNSIL